MILFYVIFFCSLMGAERGGEINDPVFPSYVKENLTKLFPSFQEAVLQSGRSGEEFLLWDVLVSFIKSGAHSENWLSWLNYVAKNLGAEIEGKTKLRSTAIYSMILRRWLSRNSSVMKKVFDEMKMLSEKGRLKAPDPVVSGSPVAKGQSDFSQSPQGGARRPSVGGRQPSPVFAGTPVKEGAYVSRPPEGRPKSPMAARGGGAAPAQSKGLGPNHVEKDLEALERTFKRFVQKDKKKVDILWGEIKECFFDAPAVDYLVVNDDTNWAVFLKSAKRSLMDRTRHVEFGLAYSDIMMDVLNYFYRCETRFRMLLDRYHNAGARSDKERADLAGAAIMNKLEDMFKALGGFNKNQDWREIFRGFVAKILKAEKKDYLMPNDPEILKKASEEARFFIHESTMVDERGYFVKRHSGGRAPIGAFIFAHVEPFFEEHMDLICRLLDLREFALQVVPLEDASNSASKKEEPKGAVKSEGVLQDFQRSFEIFLNAEGQNTEVFIGQLHMATEQSSKKSSEMSDVFKMRRYFDDLLAFLQEEVRELRGRLVLKHTRGAMKLEREVLEQRMAVFLKENEGLILRVLAHYASLKPAEGVSSKRAKGAGPVQLDHQSELRALSRKYKEFLAPGNAEGDLDVLRRDFENCVHKAPPMDYMLGDEAWKKFIISVKKSFEQRQEERGFGMNIKNVQSALLQYLNRFEGGLRILLDSLHNASRRSDLERIQIEKAFGVHVLSEAFVEIAGKDQTGSWKQFLKEFLDCIVMDDGADYLRPGVEVLKPVRDRVFDFLFHNSSVGKNGFLVLKFVGGEDPEYRAVAKKVDAYFDKNYNQICCLLGSRNRQLLSSPREKRKGQGLDQNDNLLFEFQKSFDSIFLEKEEDKSYVQALFVRSYIHAPEGNYYGPRGDELLHEYEQYLILAAKTVVEKGLASVKGGVSAVPALISQYMRTNYDLIRKVLQKYAHPDHKYEFSQAVASILESERQKFESAKRIDERHSERQAYEQKSKDELDQTKKMLDEERKKREEIQKRDHELKKAEFAQRREALAKEKQGLYEERKKKEGIQKGQVPVSFVLPFASLGVKEGMEEQGKEQQALIAGIRALHRLCKNEGELSNVLQNYLRRGIVWTPGLSQAEELLPASLGKFEDVEILGKMWDVTDLEKLISEECKNLKENEADVLKDFEGLDSKARKVLQEMYEEKQKANDPEKAIRSLARILSWRLHETDTVQDREKNDQFMRACVQWCDLELAFGRALFGPKCCIDSVLRLIWLHCFVRSLLHPVPGSYLYEGNVDRFNWEALEADVIQRLHVCCTIKKSSPKLQNAKDKDGKVKESQGEDRLFLRRDGEARAPIEFIQRAVRNFFRENKAQLKKALSVFPVISLRRLLGRDAEDSFARINLMRSLLCEENLNEYIVKAFEGWGMLGDCELIFDPMTAHLLYSRGAPMYKASMLQEKLHIGSRYRDNADLSYVVMKETAQLQKNPEDIMRVKTDLSCEDFIISLEELLQENPERFQSLSCHNTAFSDRFKKRVFITPNWLKPLCAWRHVCRDSGWREPFSIGGSEVKNLKEVLGRKLPQLLRLNELNSAWIEKIEDVLSNEERYDHLNDEEKEGMMLHIEKGAQEFLQTGQWPKSSKVFSVVQEHLTLRPSINPLWLKKEAGLVKKHGVVKKMLTNLTKWCLFLQMEEIHKENARSLRAYYSGENTDIFNRSSASKEALPKGGARPLEEAVQGPILTVTLDVGGVYIYKI